jgi:alkyl hydroperoxide reductase subunit AhpC/predicted Ser/Thr protein kinase
MAVTFVAKVGEAAPEFALACVDARNEECRSIRLRDYTGRWLALIFYPRDFSFVCPTELTSFSAHWLHFRQRGCELLGISVDSVELHREWLRTSPAEGGLGPLQFPLASDQDGTMARAYGVWVDLKQVSTRGLFIIDPDGILQYAVMHNLNVGRNPAEVLRVLDALQTGGLCPASWTSADGTIDAERALQPGRVLGHYRIRQKLGGGTFGTVFAAWDLRLERVVALKVLKRNVFESRHAVLAEARAAAKVNHSHVCTIYAVEEEDGLPLIAMEYLDGRTLSQIIAEGLPRDVARNLATQMASGLAAAHAQQVVHGDLKPANVIVSGQGTAKILDFGLAGPQHASRTASVDAHQDGRPATSPGNSTKVPEIGETLDYGDSADGEEGGIRGTPAYMSPEQAAGRRATPASDVFAFGLTLFEMLTGRMALPNASLATILARLQNQELGPRLAPQVEEAYRDLLAAMLARDAARRPVMSEVRNRLSLAEICTTNSEVANHTVIVHV